MTEPGLDVAIVTYECRELALACVASLLEHAPRRGQTVTVVDNGSRDGTAEAVAAAHPAVTVIPLGANRGFSYAMNLGLRRGRAPAMLALNPDTRIGPGALDRLLTVLDERPEVAAVGPRLVREDGTLDHAARRSFPTIAGALGHFSGVGRRAGAPRAVAQYR